MFLPKTIQDKDKHDFQIKIQPLRYLPSQIQCHVSPYSLLTTMIIPQYHILTVLPPTIQSLPMFFLLVRLFFLSLLYFVSSCSSFRPQFPRTFTGQITLLVRSNCLTVCPKELGTPLLLRCGSLFHQCLSPSLGCKLEKDKQGL